MPYAWASGSKYVGERDRQTARLVENPEEAKSFEGSADAQEWRRHIQLSANRIGYSDGWRLVPAPS